MKHDGTDITAGQGEEEEGLEEEQNGRDFRCPSTSDQSIMVTSIRTYGLPLPFRRVNLRLNTNKLIQKVFLTDCGSICHVK